MVRDGCWCEDGPEILRLDVSAITERGSKVAPRVFGIGFLAFSRRVAFSGRALSCRMERWNRDFGSGLSQATCFLGESHGSGLGIGLSGLIETVGLTEGKSVKTAHPSRIRD